MTGPSTPKRYAAACQGLEKAHRTAVTWLENLARAALHVRQLADAEDREATAVIIQTADSQLEHMAALEHQVGQIKDHREEVEAE